MHFCLFQERGTFLSRYSQLSNFLFYVHHGHINLKYSKKRDTYVIIRLKSEQRLSTYNGFPSIFVQLQQRLLCFLHLSPAAHCLLGLFSFRSTFIRSTSLRCATITTSTGCHTYIVHCILYKQWLFALHYSAVIFFEAAIVVELVSN